MAEETETKSKAAAQKAAMVTYDGPTRRDDPSTVYIYQGVKLRKGFETRVDNPDVLKVLTEGVEGHKFTIAPAKD